MATQEHGTLEHLAAVFAECREEILDEWRKEAGKLLEDLHLDHATLTDHVPNIVDGIIRDLSPRQEGADRAREGGRPPQHGFQRVSDGLDVGEVVEEFNLLRAAFFTVIARHELYLVGEAARIINRRIDGDVRMAVMAFAKESAAVLKAREAEHLAFIAHDLRTPLNAVSLLVEELKFAREQNDLAGTDEIFDMLKRNLQHVESLIQRVLQTSAPSPEIGGAIHLERRTFELWPVVQRLILDLSVVSSKHAIKVTNEIPRQLTVTADASLVAQVFQNLLGNAFKYAANGMVTISARQQGDGVTCAVRDSGDGIPPALLATVFDKHITDPEKPGSGLGLAIVKQIVEAHGGCVSVASTHGAGAQFQFTLPALSAK